MMTHLGNRVVLALVLAACMGATSATEMPYQVMTIDGSLKALLTRWSNHEGLTLTWHAPYDDIDFNNSEAGELNQMLRTKTTLASALRMALTNIVGRPGGIEVRPLQACVFSNTVLIVDITQACATQQGM